MKTAIISIAAAFCCSAAFGKGSFPLVGADGRTATIVLARDAESSSRLAAEELTNYVFKVTSRAMVIVDSGVWNAKRQRNPTVFIGTIEHFPVEVPRDVNEKLCSMRQYEASWTGVRDGALWFVGREEVAELYAVYHFLETELGIRWFQSPVPEDPGDYVPQRSEISVAHFERFTEPWFAFRVLDQNRSFSNPTPEKGKATAVRNGFQVLTPYDSPVKWSDPDDFHVKRISRRRQSLLASHLTFSSSMPPKKCFKDHPEWFALVNGERICGNDGSQMYCLSNPEVRDNVASDIIARLDRTDGFGWCNFGQADTPHGQCQCAACAALDGPNERGEKSRTTRFVKTVNAIAGKVFAKYPNADLSMWAYLTYRDLPEGVKPDPRLKLYWCSHGRCYGHALDDPQCKYNQPFLEQLRGWLKLLPRTFVYEYRTCSHDYYNCAECVEPQDIRLYRDLGLVGWKNEGMFSDSRFLNVGKGPAVLKEKFPSNWQWLYLTGHMLWNPDIDDKSFLADAEAKYYGAAYPAMAKYHALRRKLWSGNHVHFGFPHGDSRTPTLLNRPGAKERLLGLLDTAENLAAGDAVRLFRVRRDRKWLVEFWVEPNENLKKLAGKTMHVPKTRKPPVIDGRGNDEAWAGAYYATNFKMFKPGTHEVAPLPTGCDTSVGITFDDENIYLLCSAKEPTAKELKASSRKGSEVYQDDGFEFFLFPPSAENAVYHLAVNPLGNLWAQVHPGPVVPNAFGATAKATIAKDGYMIEVKIPLKNVSLAGDTWHVHFGRNRHVKKDGRWKDEHFSLDGVGYRASQNYRPLVFGTPYLRNGSFEELSEKGSPKDWDAPKGCSVTNLPSGTGLRLAAPQYAYATMAHGELAQKQTPRRLKYSFRACGSGTLQVSFLRYVDTPDPNAKPPPFSGFRRSMPKPNGVGVKCGLTDEIREFSGEYEVPAGEWAAIMFTPSKTAVIDDVVVEPLPH